MEPHALRGSIPALVTPLSKGEIDIASVGRLVEHVLGQGASGVVALGLSGELSVIPPKLRAPLIRAVISVVAGRVPVLVASGRPSLSETEAEIQEAIALGATAVLVAPSPCFGLNPQEVHRLFRHLSRLFPLPLFYYHLPSVTRAQVTPKTIHALRRDGLIAGIKDSSGNAAFLARILSLSADDETFRVFLGGSHYLLAGASMGFHGVISTIGNVASHLERRVLEAVEKGKIREARNWQGRIHELQELLGLDTGANPVVVVKAALAALGICEQEMMPPLESLEATRYAEVADKLREGIQRLGSDAGRETGGA